MENVIPHLFAMTTILSVVLVLQPSTKMRVPVMQRKISSIPKQGKPDLSRRDREIRRSVLLERYGAVFSAILLLLAILLILKKMNN